MREARGDLHSFGKRCVGYGSTIAGLTLSAGFAFALLDTRLLNAWDFSFLLVVSAVQYIGIWLYLYYGIPLDFWNAKRPDLELEKLKMERDDQKMLLRAFVFITFAILVGQVFGVLEIKYKRYLEHPDQYPGDAVLIFLNALQIAYLVGGWWALVFARCLRRMEEVKLRLKDL